MTSTPDPWWWLSFADPRAPAGKQFLGVCIVRGATLVDAVKRSHALDVNPGGHVRGHVLSDDLDDPPEELREKLVRDRTALDRMTRTWTGQGSGAMGVSAKQTKEKST